MTQDELVKEISELIAIGKDSLEKELCNPPSNCLSSPYLNGPSYRKFVVNTMLLIDRHLKDHELYAVISNQLNSKNNHYSLTVKSIIDELERITQDKEYLKKFSKADKTEVLNSGTCNIFSSDRVFIVHGHDKKTLSNIEGFLRRKGLDPIILMDKPNEGMTIIEKIENYSNVRFAIILYTPCDMGSIKDGELRPRARQNVVFEHGYFVAKLGRKNVSALYTGNVELPSDLSGILYIDMNDKNWQHQLMMDMAAAGLKFSF